MAATPKAKRIPNTPDLPACTYCRKPAWGEWAYQTPDGKTFCSTTCKMWHFSGVAGA